MSLQQSIAHYRIVSKLGEGGIGALAVSATPAEERHVTVLLNFFDNPSRRLRDSPRDYRPLPDPDHDKEQRRAARRNSRWQRNGRLAEGFTLEEFVNARSLKQQGCRENAEDSWWCRSTSAKMSNR
jgi:hypothetical protein